MGLDGEDEKVDSLTALVGIQQKQIEQLKARLANLAEGQASPNAGQVVTGKGDYELNYPQQEVSGVIPTGRTASQDEW